MQHSSSMSTDGDAPESNEIMRFGVNWNDPVIRAAGQLLCAAAMLFSCNKQEATVQTVKSEQTQIQAYQPTSKDYQNCVSPTFFP